MVRNLASLDAQTRGILTLCTLAPCPGTFLLFAPRAIGRAQAALFYQFSALSSLVVMGVALPYV